MKSEVLKFSFTLVALLGLNSARADFSLGESYGVLAVANGGGPGVLQYYPDPVHSFSSPIVHDVFLQDNSSDGIASASSHLQSVFSPGLLYLNLTASAQNSSQSGAGAGLNGVGSVHTVTDLIHFYAPVGSWVYAATSLSLVVTQSTASSTNGAPANYSLLLQGSLSTAGLDNVNSLPTSFTTTQADGIHSSNHQDSFLRQVVDSGSGSQTNVQISYSYHDELSAVASENNIFNLGVSTLNLELGASYGVTIGVYADQAMTTPLSFTLASDSGYNYSGNSASAAFAQAVPEPGVTSLILGGLLLMVLLLRRTKVDGAESQV